jgi:hypothetical protein
LRDPSYPENLNNFPSKILEFFSYNKIVISTIDYPELIDFKYLRCEFDKYSLTNIIESIISKKHEELAFLCDNSKSLIENFSEIHWKNSFNKIEIS